MGRWLFVIVLLATSARADKLTPEDLKRKNEGAYVTGLPLAAYSTDIGFGGGARAYFFYNGKRSDPRFANTPYLTRMFLQFFASTRGLQFHWLDLDAPKVFSTKYRVRSQLIYGRNINQNYFGLGNAALQPLHFPGAAGTFDQYSDYYAAQQRVTGTGEAYTKYDQFDYGKPLFIASVERSLLDGQVRVLGGLGFSYATLRDYTGKRVDAVDDFGSTHAIEAPTRMHEDCAAGKLVGCSGGWDNFLRIGAAYDTRDFEPDPNSGVFVDTGIDIGTVALGSEYDYVRLLLAARKYYSPFPDKADLVLAARGLIVWQSKGVPFFNMDALPFTEDVRFGLGGHRTLRGYRQDRFVGHAMTAATGEVRWTFYRFKIKRQKFGLIAVPFFDIGRSFDNFHAINFRDWRPGYGGALRISWNQATIITVDYGVSSEDTGFYVNFGHIF